MVREGSEMEVTRSTAIKVVLNPTVQGVPPAAHKAFRQADMRNSTCKETPVIQISAQEHF